MARGAAAAVLALLLAGCDAGPPPVPDPVLVLDAQGVVFRRGAAEYQRFPFGVTRARVERAAAAVYGKGSGRRSANPECGAGPMAFTRYGPIQLNFQDGRLVGWLMEEGAVPAADAGQGGGGAAIIPGISAAELRARSGARMVAGSALPGEFAYTTPAGRIGGILRGQGEAARVESLFAGTNCFLR